MFTRIVISTVSSLLVFVSSVSFATTMNLPIMIPKGSLQAFYTTNTAGKATGMTASAANATVKNEVCIAPAVGRLANKPEYVVIMVPADCQQYYLPIDGLDGYQFHGTTAMGQQVYLGTLQNGTGFVEPIWTTPQKFDEVLVLSEKPTVFITANTTITTFSRTPLQYFATILDNLGTSTTSITTYRISGSVTNENNFGEGFVTLDHPIDVYRGSVVSARYGNSSYMVGLMTGTTTFMTFMNVVNDLRSVGLELKGYSGGKSIATPPTKGEEKE